MITRGNAGPRQTDGRVSVLSCLPGSPPKEVSVRPAEPLFRSRQGNVFAADPPFVPHIVDGGEDIRVVDLACAGLVTPRRIGYLDVTDAAQILLHRGGQVSLHDLHVVHVVLQPQIVGANLVDDRHKACSE